MNPWLTCPDCGAMLVVQGNLQLTRNRDGGMIVWGFIDHDCSETERNYVMDGGR